VLRGEVLVFDCVFYIGKIVVVLFFVRMVLLKILVEWVIVEVMDNVFMDVFEEFF